MPVVPKRLYGPTQPATTNAVIYTVPASTYTIIKEIIVTNTTATAALISIAINGTAATAANCILEQKSVPADNVEVYALSTVLNAADTLQALQGTTSALTVTLSGTEFS